MTAIFGHGSPTDQSGTPIRAARGTDLRPAAALLPRVYPLFPDCGNPAGSYALQFEVLDLDTLNWEGGIVHRMLQRHCPEVALHSPTCARNAETL
jgi:hypothetical protein